MNDYTALAEKIVSSELFNAAVALMDDDLREAVHAEFAPCEDAEFLARYMEAHNEKYGADFIIN